MEAIAEVNERREETMRTKAGDYPKTILSNWEFNYCTHYSHSRAHAPEKRNYHLKPVHMGCPFRVKIRTIKRLKSHSTKLPVPCVCVVWPFHHLAHSFALSFCSSNLRSIPHNFQCRTNDFVITLIHTEFLRFVFFSSFFLSMKFSRLPCTHIHTCAGALLTTQTSRFSFISIFRVLFLRVFCLCFVFCWLHSMDLISYLK